MSKLKIGVFILVVLSTLLATGVGAVTPENIISVDLKDWYESATGFTADADNFGAWGFYTVGNDVYLGLGSGLPNGSNGGSVAKLDSSLTHIDSLDDQGFKKFVRSGDTLIMAGPDATFSDTWEAGNVYTYDLNSETFTKYRFRENTPEFVDSTTTNASGVYSFTGLKPTAYIVKVIPPDVDYAFSPEDAGGSDSDVETSTGEANLCAEAEHTIYLARFSSMTYTQDAGMYQVVGDNGWSQTAGSQDPDYYVGGSTQFTLNGTVWNDTDQDGVRDGGEPLMEGVRVELYSRDPYFPCAIHGLDLYKDPASEDIYYVTTTYAFESQIYKSTDNGTSWTLFGYLPTDRTYAITELDDVWYSYNLSSSSSTGVRYSANDFVSSTVLYFDVATSATGYPNYIYNFADSVIAPYNDLTTLAKIESTTTFSALTPPAVPPAVPNYALVVNDQYFYMLAANGKLFVTTDLETWEEVTDFSTIDDGALPKSLGYWSQAHKVLIGTGGTEASVYTIDHNLVRSEIFGEIIEDESDNDSEGEVAGSFSEDTKCRWSTPPDPTWIKWAPAEVDGKSGVMLTWVQYFANKVNIKIDDGTSTFPWKVHETLNDGHEFLENVGGWQQIKIKPIHHCNSGVYSQPLKLLDYPDGWYNVQK